VHDDDDDDDATRATRDVDARVATAGDDDDGDDGDDGDDADAGRRRAVARARDAVRRRPEPGQGVGRARVDGRAR
jgi:hypothetical protein